MDDLRQLPYREEFWGSLGNAAFADWERSVRPPVPPPSLERPAAFEGHATPRLEQHPDEFAWFLDRLMAQAPERILVIGSMHGGVEWHVARRLRDAGRRAHITSVDVVARPELLATLADARTRFEQDITVVTGDAAAPATRAQLAERYDAVFIDGDHGYRGAKADTDFALTRSPRLVALHDIADSDWHAAARCCVSRVWRELRARFAAEERIVGDWGGIGLVHLE